MRISAIFAIAENGIIGKDNDIPWKMKDDLKFFMQTTLGHPIIMGRRTYESFGSKPLKGRRNIILTRNSAYQAEGCEITTGLEAAIAMCEGEEEIFVIGGAGIYEEAFEKNLIDRQYKTLIHAEVEGDTRLTLPSDENWEVVEVHSHQADERNEYAYTFVTLDRKN